MPDIDQHNKDNFQPLPPGVAPDGYIPGKESWTFSKEQEERNPLLNNAFIEHMERVQEKFGFEDRKISTSLGEVSWLESISEMFQNLFSEKETRYTPQNNVFKSVVAQLTELKKQMADGVPFTQEQTQEFIEMKTRLKEMERVAKLSEVYQGKDIDSRLKNAIQDHQKLIQKMSVLTDEIVDTNAENTTNASTTNTSTAQDSKQGTQGQSKKLGAEKKPEVPKEKELEKEKERLKQLFVMHQRMSGTPEEQIEQQWEKTKHKFDNKSAIENETNRMISGIRALKVQQAFQDHKDTIEKSSLVGATVTGMTPLSPLSSLIRELPQLGQALLNRIDGSIGNGTPEVVGPAATGVVPMSQAHQQGK